MLTAVRYTRSNDTDHAIECKEDWRVCAAQFGICCPQSQQQEQEEEGVGKKDNQVPYTHPRDTTQGA